MHPWAVLLAILLILVILWDAFETIVLSRRVSRKFRLTRLFYRLLWRPWRGAARLFPAGNRRENALMVFGPLSLILLLVAWAVGLVVAFALLHWGLGSRMASADGTQGFLVDLYMSGTTLFTLGLGDVTPRTTLARGLTVAESGMGFAFLAMVIGYLPMISQAFSRREVNISMLDARAGSPPTAAQLLRRHRCEESEDLRDLLREWERWSAELLESHVSFPVLSYFRSQHDNQSWVAALTTILDEKIPDRAARMGRYLMDGLRALGGKHVTIGDVRGRGLLIGVGLARPAAPLVDTCREAGLLVLSAGEQVLRLAPPLIVAESECDRALAIIDAALGKLGA